MRLRRKIVLLAGWLCMCHLWTQSQEVYLNTQYGIYKLSGGMTDNHRIKIDNGCGIDSNVLSLAVYKDTVYYSTWMGELKRFKAGVPGSCEVLIESDFAFNSMTIDKNGIIYTGTEVLFRYNTRTREMERLGRMPFFSSGDMLFFNDKLLMAGWDAHDWTTGIFEIQPDNLAQSKLYMPSPAFFGMMALPVPCGNSRYFGLLPDGDTTKIMEIDLVTRTVMAETWSMPERFLDAASITENGIDTKITITGVVKTHTSNCAGDNGSITLSAYSPNAPVSYTLLNTGTSRSNGQFTDLRGGLYRLRMTDATGCTKDTSITIAENIPVSGCDDIYIPNAFSPNNDGINDRFKVSLSSHFTDIHLQVFGRWGNAVFAGKGNTLYWDGTLKGAPLPTGVYIYTLTYTDAAGERKNKKGTITLIR
ncbi:MAG: gliding motility-associated C-terminal domain-containing protein [Chitinophagaceae bacterium]|nr:gliding motility-associated C-terminal domain-containing protein [Chitinophagaceae bacterium]